MATPDQAAAYAAFERLRWDGEVRCPHCDTPGRSNLLVPRAGAARTRTGAPTGRRVWKCGSCRRQFSVLTGTVFAATRADLWAWVAVLADLLASDDVSSGCSDRAAGRRPGTDPGTARRMATRVAAALAAAGPVRPATGAFDPPLDPKLDPSVAAGLRAILRLAPAQVAAVRDATGAPPRRPQQGPSADYR